MKLLLYRNYYKKGVNSTLFCNGGFICFMIELPWRDNKVNISCIPEGTYNLKKRFTEHLGHHLILENVPHRSSILIHPANDALKELKGCLATVTEITGIAKGNHSRKALNGLLNYIEKDFELQNLITLTIKKGNYEINRKI